MKHIFEYLDETFKEIFEERAAIVQYDGGFSREQAEKRARIEVDELAKRRKAIDKVQK